MPKFQDHPLVEWRLRRGVSQTLLAAEAGVTRSTIIAIEEGRTRTVRPETARALEAQLRMPVGSLQLGIDSWFQRLDPKRLLTNKARAVLALQPHAVASYPTFRAWRGDIAPSPTAFASLVGANAATITQYENGIRENGMPEKVSQALLRLGISHAYLLELQRLEPS